MLQSHQFDFLQISAPNFAFIVSGMSEPRPYLVCASQRSGSTLLVESLRATTVAGNPGEFFQYLPSTSRSPQPRQWFEGVTDETVLALLAPLEPGTADTRTAEQWRDQLLSLGRTPNGVWGGKLMWNQVPLVLDRAAGLTDRSGDDLRSALDDILGRDLAFIHVYRRDVVAQAVSMWRAVQTQCGATTPRRPPRTTAPSTTRAASRTSSAFCAIKMRSGATGSRPRDSTTSTSVRRSRRADSRRTRPARDAAGLACDEPEECLVERNPVVEHTPARSVRLNPIVPTACDHHDVARRGESDGGDDRLGAVG